MLTSEEEKYVRDTWALVTPDLRENGVQFLLHFFGGYPDYIPLFRAFRDIPLDQMGGNKRFQAHAFSVINAINGLVNNLDDPEVLSHLLHKTGENHAKRKLKRQDMENVKTSLIEFFGIALKDHWTPKAESAWDKLLSAFVEKIGEGLESQQ